MGLKGQGHNSFKKWGLCGHGCFVKVKEKRWKRVVSVVKVKIDFENSSKFHTFYEMIYVIFSKTAVLLTCYIQKIIERHRTTSVNVSVLAAVCIKSKNPIQCFQTFIWYLPVLTVASVGWKNTYIPQPTPFSYGKENSHQIKSIYQISI